MVEQVSEVLKKIQERCAENASEFLPGIEEALEKLDKVEDTEEMAQVFKALSNQTKLEIVFLLAASDFPVCILSNLLEKDQSLISHHLSDLKAAGIVKGKVKGKFRIYSLRKDKLVDMLKKMIEIVGEG